MAFSDNKITVADLTGKGVTGMADTPNLTTAQMQQKLDEIAKEVIPPKFNSLCDALDLLGLSSLLTSASTSKMLYLRLNEYDQLEYSVNNVDYSLVASGKEILDPSIEADNSKKLGGKLPSYYQKATDDALNTTAKKTTDAINEINTALGNVDTTANEAPLYSPSSTYTLGKYVSHEKHIYECTTAIEVAEEWNASHWTQVTLGAEIETVNNSLTANSTHFYYDYKDGKYGYNTSAERGADTFHPFSSVSKIIINYTIRVEPNRNTGNFTAVFTKNSDEWAMSGDINVLITTVGSTSNSYGATIIITSIDVI